MKYVSDYANRDVYRNTVSPHLGCCWRTEYRQTGLFICADRCLKERAMQAVVALYAVLDSYIAGYPQFVHSLVPVEPAPGAPDVVADMCRAALLANVGPMAAVAGAFAAHVGNEVLKSAGQVIIENGGDVFMKTREAQTVAVYAGDSPVSMKVGIVVDATQMPAAVCTSSGTVGPSLSFGRADAAAVVAHDACLADACATMLGNAVVSADDISRALDMVYAVPGVIGAVAVADGACGAVGDIRLKAL